MTQEVNMNDGPFNDALKIMLSTDTAGVCERTLVEYKNINGNLWKYEYTRKYFPDGDYVDSKSSKTFVGSSV